MRPRRLSLAGQLLALQALVVLLVVLGATPVLLVQNDVAFRRSESRRVLSTAETIADTRVLETGLASGTNQGVPGEAERSRAGSGSSYVVVTDATGEVVHSSDPADIGTVLTRPGVGRSWVGVVEGSDGRGAVEARAPVLSGRTAGDVAVGDVLGYVIVGRDYPTTWERLGDTAPTLVVYVLVGSLVGLGGSLLLSRRIKRQTHGLEPEEIAGLVEHREAMLHGLREGVVAVDNEGRVTLANDEAGRLFELPGTPVGRSVDDLGFPGSVADVLGGRAPASDLALAVGGRVLVLNQMPVRNRGRRIGWVTTVRDRTELADLTRQLDRWRSTTDLLRAQAHEFSNRMHTVAGLIELGEFDEVAAFVHSDAQARQGWTERVVERVADAPVAAMLVAKGSRAAELGVSFDLDERTALEQLPESLSADVLTVLGNLVDNAMEAVTPSHGSVTALLRHAGSGVEVVVCDDGPGLPDGADDVFARGFTTKASTEPGGRGFGLALCRVVCERRGGTVAVTRAEGRRTVFSAVLPLDPREEVPS